MIDPLGQPRVQSALRTGHESPFRLNLEQQRKRAKELHHAALAGEPAACERFRQQRRHAGDGSAPRLSDAQFVIARELGLPSWPRLKAHIVAMQAAREAIGAGHVAPDGDCATLHIRCGSDLRAPLSDAGFVGDFLEYSNPLCQGPVVPCADWLHARAEFVTEAYGSSISRGFDEIAQGLTSAEEDLASAAQRYHRVVLWFEHDSYDQLILVRCLARFLDAPPACLELVSADRFPGGARFIGLGQLPPEALRLLWDGRQTVSRAQLSVGRRVWDMLRSPDPTSLAAISRANVPRLPHLAAALRRHCQEFPWKCDGLSLTERLVLRLLAERPMTIGEIFRELMQNQEPLPWLGDIMLKFIINNMEQTQAPVFTADTDGPDAPWWRERLTITPLGQEVLAGRVDWWSLRPPERWLGGVRIGPRSSAWRWDDQAERLVPG